MPLQLRRKNNAWRTRKAQSTVQKSPCEAVKCNLEGCSFEGTQTHFFRHVCEAHPDALLKFNDNAAQHVQPAGQEAAASASCGQDIEDPVVARRNEKGDTARPGRYGNFHCGQALDF
uniref:Uncharacterized protein n=1 Tax=Palpitomonas bilix TaxID=652834 RepID=A0A7S3GGY3_9EUKA|mmetsp:Transcript_48827/g.126478  ORF Transcript_48827/g.126478 Transcript_48827/m.126478 type:complete len:117 (+) Transcript_48827:372-722(+)